MSATTIHPRLITVVRRKNRPVCLMLPGAGGGLNPYLRLAAHLGQTHNIYGVRAAGLVAGEEPERSVDEMARAALTAAEDGGITPDVIFGWSLGGVVAWEVADRLAKRGTHPDLIIVDTSPLPRVSTPETDDGIKDVIVTSMGRVESEIRDRVLTTFQAQVDALTDYRATGTYPGRVLLVLCADDEFTGREEALARWRELAPDLTEAHVAAGHFAVLEQDHVGTLAEIIGAFLAPAADRGDSR